MKLLKIFSLTIAFLAISAGVYAQEKTETFKVSGNCGMCKSKIEKSAKAAGASFAAWDVETKVLTVKYNSESTNTAKIQKKIASVGYDNEGARATKAAYNKLHGCCKYDRSALVAADCCTEDCKKACEERGCCKDGAVCEENCCKEGKAACCSGEEKCGKSCCSKEGK